MVAMYLFTAVYVSKSLEEAIFPGPHYKHVNDVEDVQIKLISYGKRIITLELPRDYIVSTDINGDLESIKIEMQLPHLLPSARYLETNNPSSELDGITFGANNIRMHLRSIDSNDLIKKYHAMKVETSNYTLKDYSSIRILNEYVRKGPPGRSMFYEGGGDHQYLVDCTHGIMTQRDHFIPRWCQFQGVYKNLEYDALVPKHYLYASNLIAKAIEDKLEGFITE